MNYLSCFIQMKTSLGSKCHLFWRTESFQSIIYIITLWKWNKYLIFIYGTFPQKRNRSVSTVFSMSEDNFIWVILSWNFNLSLAHFSIITALIHFIHPKIPALHKLNEIVFQIVFFEIAIRCILHLSLNSSKVLLTKSFDGLLLWNKIWDLGRSFLYYWVGFSLD